LSIVSRVTDRVLGRSRPRVTLPVDIGDRRMAEGLDRKHLFGRNAELPDLPVLMFPPAVPANGIAFPPDELVVGAARGGEAKVYPISTLQWHHIVNDDLAGEPLTIAFCRKCYSGVGLDPVVEGQRLTFQVFGLYLGSMVMSDDQTGTVWAPFTGQALVGPLAGRRLAFEPVEMTTLGRWLERHPDGLVPDPLVMVRPDPLVPGQSEHARALRRTVPRWDPRLDARELVLGVQVGGASRAYVVGSEPPGPMAFEDQLAGTPLLLLGEEGVWPLAYDRRLEGRILAFRLEAGKAVDDSGSSWKSGRAVNGPMTGAELAFVPSHLSEWYAWAANHPDTDVARPEG
jgi:hypothetical protein